MAAKSTKTDSQTTTGLPKTDPKNPRLHFDIYAILESSQELYFGHEVEVNINKVETVKLTVFDEEENRERSLEKCYLSPTKRRGVERRCLLWAPVSSGELLGDKQKCGIPKTCAQTDCPICATYGALLLEKQQNRTLIGRVTHGGGVAVQELDPLEKQRAMHPSRLVNQKEETPTPFKREYNQPGILYPVSNHALSVTETEFASVAYGFLDSLPRMGAGNPKGVSIAESKEMPLLVLDKYLVPRGKRPIISPGETKPQRAIAEFIRLAGNPETNSEHIQQTYFDRWIGDAALEKLQEYSAIFVDTHLQT